MRDARSGALAILREARLTVLSADSEEGDTTVALAKVEGHHGEYLVSLAYGRVTCTAPADRAEPDARCAHAYALKLVTGGGF